MLIFFLLLVMIYIIKVIEKADQYCQTQIQSDDHVNLLHKVNKVILSIIRNEKNKEEALEQLRKIEIRLNKFVSSQEAAFKEFVYKKITLKQESQEKKTLKFEKTNLSSMKALKQVSSLKEVEEELSSDQDSSPSSESNEQEDFFQMRGRRRDLMLENRLFEFSLEEEILFGLNTSLSRKIQHLTLNKKKLVLAQFSKSLFHVLKEMIFNMLLLTILENVSFFSLVLILVIFGLRHLVHIKFQHLFFFVVIIFVSKLIGREMLHVPSIDMKMDKYKFMGILLNLE